MRPPMFIVGCPRSGTTLLARLLAHTTYGSPVETHFITKYYNKLDAYGDLKNKDAFTRLVHHILAERPVMQWNLSLDVDQLYASMERFDYAEVVDKICMERMRGSDKTSWGDKTPHYILDFNILYDLFPDSKYIYIVRDGRDVALSLLEKDWGPNNVYSCATYWEECNVEHGAYETLKAQGRLYTLRYEDLLTRADRIIPEIYEFLGEATDSENIAIAVKEIKATNSNKWKSRMTSSDIALFEHAVADTLERFGYETSHAEERISSFAKAWFALGDAFHKGMFLVKTNTVHAIKIKYFNRAPFAD